MLCISEGTRNIWLLTSN